MKSTRSLSASLSVAVAAMMAAVALMVACSAPPKSAPIVGDDGFVTTIVSGETLATQGLLPAYPACCPGAECCAPPYFCAYFDTADASLGDAGAAISPVSGLRLVGTSPKAGVGAACKNQNATAFSVPVAIATLLSYDNAMDYGQVFLPWPENDTDSWIVDGARRGLGDFSTDSTLSNGLVGLVARQPRWPGYDCYCACIPFTSICGCAATCHDRLSCNQGDYDGASSGAYTLAAQGGSMMGVLPDPYFNDSFTEMSSGNPLTLGIRAAKTRLTTYWNTNKMATLAIVVTSADYEYGCGNDMNTLASEAYASAFNGTPRISTNVVGFNMDANMSNAFNMVRRNGWGAMSRSWPGNARTDMKNAMTFMRSQEKAMAFFVNPPTNGEAIDDASFKFYLTADGTETLVPNAGAQSGCGSSAQGFWLTRPDGATGRVRINLCPGTVAVAARAFTVSGRVVYDCVETFPSTATFVREFDLSRCASSDTSATRAVRLDWDTTLPADTAVTFNVKLAAQKSQLASAPVAVSASALQWVPGSEKSYVDLTNRSLVTLPPNYQWARVEMALKSSVDTLRTPTISSWKLTFTCTDGS